ncbi:Gfo/Idh/MocA family oxidoreductase [bacterium]|nr:Gfo/Idh/MocA family oxidoreductase [candidate division CSSED10-310 bacterium]
MRVIIVGAGSIGRRHAANFAAIGISDLAFVRRSPDPVSSAPGVPVFPSLDAAIRSAGDLIMVCTPAPFHLETANKAVDAGCHVFIEKPLSHTWDEVESFIRKISLSPVCGWVGYDMRFDTGIEALKDWIDSGRFGRPLAFAAEVGQYLPDWRPDVDYRKGVTARSDLGGGVLLELSHELDLARWLMGPYETISAFSDTLLLDMDVEDIATCLIRFQSGALGMIHLDALQRTMKRWCRIVCSEATLWWDACARTAHAVGSGGAVLESIAWTTEDRDARFRKELAAVLREIDRRIPARISIEEGAETLRWVLAAKQMAGTAQRHTRPLNHDDDGAPDMDGRGGGDRR